jgi:hypothetical protein
VRRLTDILDGVQGLVAAEAARMSLEEEVNQSVSKAVSLAEAADAAADSDDTDSDDTDLDLSRLAPPAPETVATGTAPPRNGESRPAQPGRPGPGGRPVTPGSDEPRDAPGPVGGTPAGAGRIPAGRPGATPPSMSGGTGRLGSPMPEGAPRSMPMPTGSPRPGPMPAPPGRGEGLADRDAMRDSGRAGLIDPDEPTDGRRLMQ